MGAVSESNTDGTVDSNHLDTYVHGASEWKIGLYEGGIDCCAPYNSYKYGVENHSTMTRKDLVGLDHLSQALPIPLRLLIERLILL